MRYKLDTQHGKATLLDRRRVIAYGLDIVDAEKIVEALNRVAALDVTGVRRNVEYPWHEVGFKNGVYFERTVPRYPEQTDVTGSH
jgi:hypothetical protein